MRQGWGVVASVALLAIACASVQVPGQRFDWVAKRPGLPMDTATVVAEETRCELKTGFDRRTQTLKSFPAKEGFAMMAKILECMDQTGYTPVWNSTMFPSLTLEYGQWMPLSPEAMKESAKVPLFITECEGRAGVYSKILSSKDFPPVRFFSVSSRIIGCMEEKGFTMLWR